jgi:hypothetical protein
LATFTGKISQELLNNLLFTVDNGEEFSGKSWIKVSEPQNLIGSFGGRAIQNHKGHCEEKVHLKRPTQLMKDGFHIFRVLGIRSEAGLSDEAMSYICYYDNLREHSSLGYQTPFAYLKSQLPDIDDKTRFVILIMLDKAYVQLGP